MAEGAGRAVALVGPTASGKSDLAHSVALALGGTEIAAIDAMTVYRGLEIGTAKPTPAMRAEVRYHLLDLIEPDESCSVAEFQRAATAVVGDAAERGVPLILVGGTGLYLRAVLDGLTLPGQFPEVRNELERRADDDLAPLFSELQSLDPLAASRTTATNRRRIVRALEVTIGAGRPFSSFGPGLDRYETSTNAQVGLRIPLAELDARIAARFERWMEEGLLEEVRALHRRPGGLSRTARQAAGYRQLLAHLDGEVDLATSVAEAITATKRLARRQMRWFARDPRVEWFDDVAAARTRLVELITTRVGDSTSW